MTRDCQQAVPGGDGDDSDGAALANLVEALTVTNLVRARLSPSAPAKRSRVGPLPEVPPAGGPIASGLRSCVSQPPAPCEEILQRLPPSAVSPTASLKAAMVALAGSGSAAPRLVPPCGRDGRRCPGGGTSGGSTIRPPGRVDAAAAAHPSAPATSPAEGTAGGGVPAAAQPAPQAEEGVVGGPRPRRVIPTSSPSSWTRQTDLATRPVRP